VEEWIEVRLTGAGFVNRGGVRVALIAALANAGCGSAGASPTPLGLTELRVLLARHGVTTLSAVSGDSACPERALSDNALHLTVRTASDRTPRDLYLYLFRTRDFDATETTMDACLADLSTARPGSRITRIDAAPYRALGADWSSDLQRAVETALGDAAP
jgi:hypothetical protein